MKRIFFITLSVYALTFCVDPNTTKVETVPVLSIPGNPLAQPSMTTSKVQTVATTQPAIQSPRTIESRRQSIAQAPVAVQANSSAIATRQIAQEPPSPGNVLAALKPIAPKSVPQK